MKQSVGFFLVITIFALVFVFSHSRQYQERCTSNRNCNSVTEQTFFFRHAFRYTRLFSRLVLFVKFHRQLVSMELVNAYQVLNMIRQMKFAFGLNGREI